MKTEPTRLPLLCSTGTLTRFPDLTDPTPIFSTLPMLRADGFEILVYETWYGDLEYVAKMLLMVGLSYPAVHAEKEIGPLLATGDPDDIAEASRRWRWNCTFAGAINADIVVLHLWGLPHADERLDHQLDRLPALLDVAQECSVRLACETIPCRLRDPLANVEQAIARDARTTIALDTEFLAWHNQLDAVLDVDWLWERPDVIRHLHVKDYGGRVTDKDGLRCYLHPGEGTIDFQALLRGLHTRGFTGNVSLEAPAVEPNGGIDVPRLNASLDRLREWMA